MKKYFLLVFALLFLGCETTYYYQEPEKDSLTLTDYDGLSYKIVLNEYTSYYDKYVSVLGEISNFYRNDSDCDKNCYSWISDFTYSAKSILDNRIQQDYNQRINSIPQPVMQNTREVYCSYGYDYYYDNYYGEYRCRSRENPGASFGNAVSAISYSARISQEKEKNKQFVVDISREVLVRLWNIRVNIFRKQISNDEISKQMIDLKNYLLS